MTTPIRKPSAERRSEIAEAVLRIIGEQGLTALTTSSLAREVGVTSGALFRHFASRDDILREAARHAIVKIEATFPDAALPPLERLLALVRNRVRLLGSDPGLAWLLGSEQAYLALPEEAVGALRVLIKRSRRFLLEALREGAAAGSIRGDIDPQVLLLPVMGTIHVLCGARSVHGAAAGGRPPRVGRVLPALVRLLAPPGGNDGSGATSMKHTNMTMKRTQRRSARRLKDDHRQ